MDNTDKIDADFTHSEVSLFLGDELKKLSQKRVDRYNLQEEYAKTSKNKAFFYVLLLQSVCCLLFLALLLLLGLLHELITEFQ